MRTPPTWKAAVLAGCLFAAVLAIGLGVSAHAARPWPAAPALLTDGMALAVVRIATGKERSPSETKPRTPSPSTTPSSPTQTGAQPKRRPTLLPAAQRRNRSSLPPPLTREERSPPARNRRAIVPAPLPPAFDPPGDRGPPLGTPRHLDPLLQPAVPTIGWPPLPPARQVPGEKGILLGPSPFSIVR